MHDCKISAPNLFPPHNSGGSLDSGQLRLGAPGVGRGGCRTGMAMSGAHDLGALQGFEAMSWGRWGRWSARLQDFSPQPFPPT